MRAAGVGREVVTRNARRDAPRRVSGFVDAEVCLPLRISPRRTRHVHTPVKMSHARRGPSHSAPARISRRACSSSAALWTNPAASATLPVYEDVVLAWDPTCVTIASPNVDLYLSVELASSNEWQAVHLWTSVPFAPGEYATQLKPTWWNASTGAGSVQAQVRRPFPSPQLPPSFAGPTLTRFVRARGSVNNRLLSAPVQFSLVPAGQPSWNTPAPAGPVFTVAYNGS